MKRIAISNPKLNFTCLRCVIILENMQKFGKAEKVKIVLWNLLQAW
jgi:hypothetical protein